MSLTTWRQFQFYYLTPIKDPQLGTTQPLYSDPTLSAAVPYGKNKFALAVKSSTITYIDFETSKILHSWQAVPPEYHISYLKGVDKWLLAVAECINKPTLIRIWSVEDKLPSDHLQYHTQVEVKNGNNTYPISTISISKDLSCIVTGFVNGKIILIRGDLLHDRGSRQRIIYEDQNNEPITSLYLNSTATLCFASTTSLTLLFSTTGRNNGLPESILNSTNGVDLHCSDISTSTNEFVASYPNFINFYSDSGEVRKLQCDIPNIKRLFVIDKSHILILSKVESSLSSHTSANAHQNMTYRLLILDIKHNIISLNTFISSSIIDIFSMDNERLFLLGADGTIFSVSMKSKQEQLDIAIQKENFKFSLELAEEFGIGNLEIQKIHRKYGDFLFDKKNERDKATIEYIKCLDVVDISEIISKIGVQESTNPNTMCNLTDYLWALIKNNRFTADHVTLLIISLIKLKNVEQIDKFIRHFTRLGKYSEKYLLTEEDIDDETFFYSNENLFDLTLVLSSLRDARFDLQAYRMAKKFSKDPNILVDILLNTIENPMEALNYIRTLSIDDTLRVIVANSKQLLQTLPNATTVLLIDVFTGNYKPYPRTSEQDLLTNKPSPTESLGDQNDKFYSYNTFVSYMNKTMGLDSLVKDETDSNKLVIKSPTYHPPKPSLVFNAFIKQPFEFVVFLEACLESYKRYEGSDEDKQVIFTTLYDLYLTLVKDDPERKEDWQTKAKNILQESNKMISDRKNASIPSDQVDNSLMLLISHMNEMDWYSLPEDTSSSTSNGSLEGTFRSMILIEDSKKCFEFFKKHSPTEPKLYAIALSYFISKKSILDTIGGEETLKSDIILPILKNDLMSVLDVIDVLGDTSLVTFGVIQDILIQYVEEEEVELEKSKKLVGLYEDELNKKKNQVEKILQETKPTTLRLKNENCQQCRTSLELPILFFKCGHVYHQRCLNEETDMHNVEKLFRCPMCIEELTSSQKLVEAQKEAAMKSSILESVLQDIPEDADRFGIITDLIGRGGLEYSHVNLDV